LLAASRRDASPTKSFFGNVLFRLVITNTVVNGQRSSPTGTGRDLGCVVITVVIVLILVARGSDASADTAIADPALDIVVVVVVVVIVVVAAFSHLSAVFRRRRTVDNSRRRDSIGVTALVAILCHAWFPVSGARTVGHATSRARSEHNQTRGSSAGQKRRRRRRRRRTLKNK
jgi:protein-S-isoprenylcysteine O-methyltransferase Ste14